MNRLGYRPELCRNRSGVTLLFQVLATASIPLGGQAHPLASPGVNFALAWIAFKWVLFTLPSYLLVTAVSMKYGSVFVGLLTFSFVCTLYVLVNVGFPFPPCFVPIALSWRVFLFPVGG